MDDEVLTTSADDLYELVKSKKKISIEDAAKALKQTDKVIQSLVDFLVEERIFGIEYKFTTPYIYISQEKGKKIELEEKPKKVLVTKEQFFQKVSKWNIPAQKIDQLWKKYLQENLNNIKEEFYIRANTRNLSKEKIDHLWDKYNSHLQ
jgi:hypothetical protein